MNKMKLTLLSMTPVGDQFSLEIEQTRGWFFKKVDTIKIRGHYTEFQGGNWFYYPEGHPVGDKYSDAIYHLIQDMEKQQKRLDRIAEWSADD
tara:strand:- start:159 stop:434 length:276 start_codon:yes stop_codon:yes gene_type:complete